MKTDRLFLRERTKSLFEEIVRQPVKNQLDFFGLQSTNDLEAEVTKTRLRNENNQRLHIKWDLLEIHTKAVAGHCGFHNWLVEHQRAEIGYFLHEQFRGKGYMTEALKEIIAYGFNTMNLNRIEAFISPDNQPSIKLVTDLKFTCEGKLRARYIMNGVIYDSLVYSLLKTEF